MCGIHFVVNNEPSGSATGLRGFMEDAFITNQLRGTDATGAFQVMGGAINPDTGTRRTRYAKLAVPGAQYIKGLGSDIVRDIGGSLLTVGHVRHATYGRNTDDNAHPFHIRREDGTGLMGVHNGSLEYNWRWNDGASKFDVDSRWLYEHIAKHGIKAFEDIDGAFALVWYDSRTPDHFYIARNSKRPLFWAWTEKQRSMLACSELGMLGWLADRNGLKLWSGKGGTQLFYPEEGYLHKISILEPSVLEKEKLPAYRTRSAPHAATTVVNNRSHWNPQGQGSYYLDSMEQVRIIGAVKEVLRKARNEVDVQKCRHVRDGSLPASKCTTCSRELEVLGVEPIQDSLSLEVAMHTALTDWCNKRDVAGQTFIDVIDSSTSTQSEQKAAKDAGMLGLIVDFCGYFHEADEALVYGDFRITPENGQTIVYDSVVRMIPAALAEAKYIDPTKTNKMVVVGKWNDLWVLEAMKEKETPLPSTRDSLIDDDFPFPALSNTLH